MNTKSTLLMAAALVVGLSSNATARDLTIVGFGGGYQDSAREHLFQSYAKEKGVKVVDDVYNGEMAKIYSMVEAGDTTIDVIMVEAPELVRGCEDGVFEKLNYDVIDKTKIVDTAIHECGVGGAGWGVTVFYDKARHANGPTNLQEFWDVEKFPGKRSLRTGPKITLEVALMADGVPAAEVYDVLSTPEVSIVPLPNSTKSKMISFGGSLVLSRCNSSVVARLITHLAIPAGLFVRRTKALIMT